MYYVWKRNDGYIGASAGRMPRGWEKPSDGTPVTFEELGKFDDWYTALKLILKEREILASRCNASLLSGR